MIYEIIKCIMIHGNSWYNGIYETLWWYIWWYNIIAILVIYDGIMMVYSIYIYIAIMLYRILEKLYVMILAYIYRVYIYIVYDVYI